MADEHSWQVKENTRRLDKLEGALERLTNTINDAMTGRTETAMYRHWVDRINKMEHSITDNRKHFDASIVEIRKDVGNVQTRVNQIFAGLAVLTVAANLLAPWLRGLTQ